MNSPLEHDGLRIDLLRHGEPAGGDRYRGSVDDPLSPEGWRQMRAATPPPVPWQGILTSPLRRCAEFAEELARQHGIPLRVEEDLREMSFGAWEGRTGAEILAQDGERLRAFWQDPAGNPPPGGEPLDALTRRVAGVWERAVQEHARQHLLMVVHGGVIRALMSHLLGIPLQHLSRVTVPYACLTRFHVDRSAHTPPLPRLIFHGASLK